jgi:hypothetical protein
MWQGEGEVNAFFLEIEHISPIDVQCNWRLSACIYTFSLQCFLFPSLESSQKHVTKTFHITDNSDTGQMTTLFFMQSKRLTCSR